MKYLVLQKTKYILNNSWISALLPAGVSDFLKINEKGTPQAEKSFNFRSHPAESRIPRSTAAKTRP
jgi:hypothetical protein